MFTNPKLSTDFIINPKTLHDSNGLLIEESVLEILEKNKIILKLNFSDTNPGDTIKPVIVLVHGNSASKNVFDDQVKHFSNDYRVIAMDLLGHGDSTNISNLENISSDEKNILCTAFYNPLAMISEIESFLKSKNISHAHFIGWSLGGHIAYGLAVSNPELVSSITSIGSPPIKFCSDGFKKGFTEWFVNALLPEWVNQPKVYSMEEARGIGIHIGFDNKDIEAFAHDMVISDPEMRKNLFLKLDEYNAEKYSGSSLDAETFALETNIPLCLIVGKKDAGINASYIASIGKNMRNSLSSTHVIENGSHAVFKTHAAEYYLIVDNFITQTNQLKFMPGKK